MKLIAHVLNHEATEEEEKLKKWFYDDINSKLYRKKIDKFSWKLLIQKYLEDLWGILIEKISRENV